MGKNVGIVAFAFGMPAGIPSNLAISRITSLMASWHRLPVFTQKGLIRLGSGLDATYVAEKPSNPAPTLEIAFQCVDWAIQRKISTLWVVGAEPHLWRCTRDLRYAARKAGAKIAITVAPEVYEVPESILFCANSSQSFHRTRAQWKRNDWIMRNMPMFLYVHVYTRLRKVLSP